MPAYRFAFVASRYFEFGGLERDMLGMATECLNRGHTVDLFVWKWKGTIPDGIRVHLFKNKAFTNHGKNHQLAQFLSSSVVKGGFDCIVGFRKIPGLDIYYAADPCYAEILEKSKPFFWRYIPRAKHLKKQELGVFKKGLTTEILTIAHGQKDIFIKHYETEASRFHLMSSGVSFSHLVKPDERQLEALRNELNILPGEIVILQVGSDFKRKGVDRSIRALASLPLPLRKQVRLVVVGECSPLKFHCLAYWHGVDSQVTFVGGRRDMASFYHIVNLLIHPAYLENTGTIILEAMYCGVPVLTTANCGYSHHVTLADAGLVTPEPFEQTCLNRQLYHILTSGKENEWGKKGQDYCSQNEVFGLISQSVDLMEKRAEKNQQVKKGEVHV